MAAWHINKLPFCHFTQELRIDAEDSDNANKAAFSLLFEGILTDEDCYQSFKKPTLWKGEQNMVPFTPSFKVGRPAREGDKRPQERPTAPLRPTTNLTAAPKRHKAAANSPAPALKRPIDVDVSEQGGRKTNQLPWSSDAHAAHSTLAAAAAANSAPAAEAGFYRGKVEGQASVTEMQASMHKELVETLKSSAATSRELQDKHHSEFRDIFEKQLMETRNDTLLTFDVMAKATAQTFEFARGMSMQQHGHPFQPHAAAPMSKKEAFLDFLTNCDMEDHIDSLWNLGVKSAMGVVDMSDEDYSHLGMNDFEVRRIKKAAGLATGELQAAATSGGLP